MNWLRSAVFLKTSLVVLVISFVISLFGLLVAMADTGATCGTGLQSCESWGAGFNQFDKLIQPLYPVSFTLLGISLLTTIIALVARSLRQEK